MSASPESTAARNARLKTAAGYVAPHEQKVCSRCLHFKTRGDRPQGYCKSLHCDVAGKGVCRMFVPNAAKYRGRDKLKAQGAAHWNAKLTEPMVVEILRLKGQFRGCEVARIFGVCHTNVTRIWNGRSWKHVPRVECAGESAKNGGFRAPRAISARPSSQEDGSCAERVSNSKSGVPQGTVGSNPTLSAT